MGKNTIQILDKKAQEGMRKVCKISREVLDIAAAELKPGVTTDFIDEVVHKACIERKVSFDPGIVIRSISSLTVSGISITSELRALPQVCVHLGQ